MNARFRYEVFFSPGNVISVYLGGSQRLLPCENEIYNVVGDVIKCHCSNSA